MSHIFVSYSSQDKDICERLVEKLEKFFRVWIDREALQGGIEWERAIEQALVECDVFIVLVSPHSNESEWVARETIRAEQLSKPRIPILLSGELPFRLLNLHYIDFQGSFEGGFRDLLEVLKQHMKVEAPTSESVDQLVGRGIRAYLSQEFSEANSLIGQALALEPDLASSLELFWNALSVQSSTNYAEQLKRLIEQRDRVIVEESISLANYKGRTDAFKWSLYLDVDDELLDQVDYVRYELFRTYRDPIRIIRDRESKFKLTTIGWGTFRVPVSIHFKEGSVVETYHWLQFTGNG